MTALLIYKCLFDFSFAGHIPIHEKAIVSYNSLLWNHEQLLSLIHCHKNVILYLAGHDHFGGYTVDNKGVHHLTINGLIEAKPGTLDSATFELYPSKMIVKGSGRVSTFEIDLPYKTHDMT